jgi:hypothetical protein
VFIDKTWVTEDNKELAGSNYFAFNLRFSKNKIDERLAFDKIKELNSFFESYYKKKSENLSEKEIINTLVDPNEDDGLPTIPEIEHTPSIRPEDLPF